MTNTTNMSSAIFYILIAELSNTIASFCRDVMAVRFVCGCTRVISSGTVTYVKQISSIRYTLFNFGVLRREQSCPNHSGSCLLLLSSPTCKNHRRAGFKLAEGVSTRALNTSSCGALNRRIYINLPRGITNTTEKHILIPCCAGLKSERRTRIIV